MSQIRKSTPRRSGLFPAAALASMLLLSACVHNPPKLYGEPGTSPSPDVPWTPPAKAVSSAPAAPAAALPSGVMERVESLTLADIVDIALRNSPTTEAAWARARSKAAAYGSKQGGYYPQLEVGANISRTQGTFANGAISYFQRSYGPTASLNWLLFDFGGREAAVAETRQALIAADWMHNAAIQGVILQVEQAYHLYVANKALLAAEESAVKDAQANLDAAEARHEAGVATIADVLQARTALAQARLALESVQGAVQTTRGALATAMGLPANTPYDVGSQPEDVPLDKVSEEVDHFLDVAQAQRPDLAAARAQAAKAEAHVKTVKAEGRPSISANATTGRIYYDNSGLYGNTYTTAIQLRIPLFTGLSHTYDVQEARADLRAAQADLKTLQDTVVLQVWSSYYALKTAQQRVKTSDDLLRSATESHDVALARYKAGVGTILDLLAAQAALENARAQVVQARSDWYTSLAQLSHDTGTLSVSDLGSEAARPIDIQKEEKP